MRNLVGQYYVCVAQLGIMSLLLNTPFIDWHVNHMAGHGTATPWCFPANMNRTDDLRSTWSTYQARSRCDRASTLVAMASNPSSDGLHPSSDGLHSSSNPRAMTSTLVAMASDPVAMASILADGNRSIAKRLVPKRPVRSWMSLHRGGPSKIVDPNPTT